MTRASTPTWLSATQSSTLRVVPSLLRQSREGQVVLRCNNLTRIIILIDHQLAFIVRRRDYFIFCSHRRYLILRRTAQIERDTATRLVPTRLLPLGIG